MILDIHTVDKNSQQAYCFSCLITISKPKDLNEPPAINE